MMPGRACNACHADFNAATGEAAPIFRFAGTVYAASTAWTSSAASHARLCPSAVAMTCAAASVSGTKSASTDGGVSISRSWLRR